MALLFPRGITYSHSHISTFSSPNLNSSTRNNIPISIRLQSSSMTDNSDKTSVQLWPWQKRALENGRTPLPESPGERPWLNLSPDTKISATPLTALINASTPKPRDCGEYHQIHVKTKHQLTSLTGCHTALPLVVRK